ncbi:MAG TPA: choice-of-anchor J domain-containing protein, partial [candidate division Zixibacteria bacterium]|nr:choice-of-anchor J domain-containing protein [candidate division Zixibacteria bacterium]
MVNCRKTIALMAFLVLALLVVSSAVLADSKQEANQLDQQTRSISNQRPQDPAVTAKAQTEAELAAKIQAQAAMEQHPPNEALAADAKTSPERGARPLYDPRVSVLLSEGFESGVVPPAGWSEVVTNASDPTFNWDPGDFPFEGLVSAQVLYDPALAPQDEWLVSPVLDLTSVTSDIRVEFYWDMSYFWGVDPNNNYDLELWVSTDGGATFSTLLWDESGEGVFGNYVYYKEVVSLSAYMGENDVVLAWRYVGSDGAQADVDFINVTDDAPPVLGPGDACGDPLKIELPAELPYADGNTTCGRSNDYFGTCLAPYDGGEDIVYEITVTSPVTIDITLDPLGTTYTGFVVDDMCPPDGSCLATKTNFSSSPYTLNSLSLAAGTYYLMVDTWPSPDCIPDFDLTIEESPPAQSGDNCSD